jgi:hypothetical protein
MRDVGDTSGGWTSCTSLCELDATVARILRALWLGLGMTGLGLAALCSSPTDGSRSRNKERVIMNTRGPRNARSCTFACMQECARTRVGADRHSWRDCVTSRADVCVSASVVDEDVLREFVRELVVEDMAVDTVGGE